ncbi:MAG TPA: hypothetical protein VH482_06780 [Thermomicrobiales bacterium]|jgi:hypothetical protein
MPEQHKRFETVINDLGDIVRVVIVREGKQVLSFVAQYEVMIDNEPRPALRYDTAHGFAHRDVLGWDGRTVRWDRMREVDYATALTEAVDDLMDNWDRHRAEFLRRRR